MGIFGVLVCLKSSYLEVSPQNVSYCLIHKGVFPSQWGEDKDLFWQILQGNKKCFAIELCSSPKLLLFESKSLFLCAPYSFNCTVMPLDGKMWWKKWRTIIIMLTFNYMILILIRSLNVVIVARYEDCKNGDNAGKITHQETGKISWFFHNLILSLKRDNFVRRWIYFQFYSLPVCAILD